MSPRTQSDLSVVVKEADLQGLWIILLTSYLSCFILVVSQTFVGLPLQNSTYSMTTERNSQHINSFSLYAKNDMTEIINVLNEGKKTCKKTCHFSKPVLILVSLVMSVLILGLGLHLQPQAALCIHIWTTGNSMVRVIPVSYWDRSDFPLVGCTAVWCSECSINIIICSVYRYLIV